MGIKKSTLRTIRDNAGKIKASCIAGKTLSVSKSLCGKAANADEASARAFPPTVKKFIQEEGYTLDQIFNLDETGLYWKNMPTRTYISKTEAHAPGFKAAKNRMTVLLGANASGDLKLKPVLIMRQATLPPTIAELSDNIKVLFLPPNTTSLLHPMDQGVIAAFKAYYLRHTFKKLIAATEEGNDKASVLQFWKSFNIKHAIDIIVEAWGDVSKDCLSGVWQKLLPDLIHDFTGFDASEELPKIKENCVSLAKQVGFAEVESVDVEELLKSHYEDLSTADLQLVAAGEIEDAEDDEVKDAKPRELPTSVLSSILRKVDKQLQILEDNDYTAERSRIA
ncbi:tigger transposable element-derived protein 1-like, partial [Homarus americanus]|uniref:tigger transposable element-derived protein 1-like n=1 Tax=Homarus americanus TaxID=6706 RepID=UPI001C482483